MKNVEIYTSDTCIQCIKAKEYLKNRNVEFKEYNISKDLEAKRELIRMGYMSIPVLLIDGEHVLGFDLNRIESFKNKYFQYFDGKSTQRVVQLIDQLMK